MDNLTKFLLLTIVLCITVGCQLLPSAVLQNETCSPPCWNGITPGQTSFQEITTKMKNISVVDPKSIKTMSWRQNDDSVDFNFSPNIKEDGGRIYAENGVVQAIFFLPKANVLLLSEVLQKWGSPDQYISQYFSNIETPYLATIIIYSKKSILLTNISYISAEDIPKFENNFPIQSVWFTNPTAITAPLENSLIDRMNHQDLLTGLKPWTGLGEIMYLTKDH